MTTHPRTTRRSQPASAKGLHPRNRHKNGYDLAALATTHPELAAYIKPSPQGGLTLDFANPQAVKALNAALLHHDYQILGWDLPEGALCPPIPGRADYIHHLSDLLESQQPGIKLLDIGTGANGVYPLLACQIYGWESVASDINSESLANVARLLDRNPHLKKHCQLRLQPDKNQMFHDIIQPDERFDVSVCNPPFHASLEEALRANRLKVNNLARHRGEARQKSRTAELNFGGQGAELWCKGGERLFLKKLAKESQIYKDQCRWFTSLVSQAEHLPPIKKLIRKLGAVDLREIEMKQGNKVTRILAWTYQP